MIAIIAWLAHKTATCIAVAAGDWTGALHDLFKPAGRAGYSSSGGNTCPSCTTATITVKPTADIKKEALPTMSSDTNTRLQASTSGSGATLLDIAAPLPSKKSMNMDTMPVGSKSKRRISVDVLSHYSEQVLPTAAAARMRRSSAPGYGSAAAGVEETGRESSFTTRAAGSAMDKLRNMNRMLAGAWDPRAETVIQEAHERLEQFVQHSTGG